ncbi:DUF992 domain-containing protein [Pararhizobium sp. IMCC21322]|uniref:DUF992 domain-containing protein n=1 Tax=Pararhizobium sp. IMCC21322 TaxID=3067903 RepID=UPI002740901C|nr:DUF992 domain-containing protein [Pararhizobium sp. IMCC21322]
MEKLAVFDTTASRPVLAASLFAVLGLAVFTPDSAWSQADALSNAGTLTCTVAPGDHLTNTEPRSTSCQFEPLSGPRINFSGTLKRLSDPAPTADRIVLVWTVFTEDGEISGVDLEGDYKSAADSEATERHGHLIAQSNDQIELRPLVTVPDAIPEDASLVLELDLKYERA